MSELVEVVDSLENKISKLLHKLELEQQQKLVLEREMDHLLSPDALMTLQIHAIQTWLIEQRSISDIQISP